MLTNEQRFFLTVLSDYAHGRQTVVPDGLDEAVLISISKQQQTDSILYFQTHLPSLQPAFASVTYHVVNGRKLQEIIHTAFTNARIPYLIFKGTEIASYYLHPELRSMGDLDILVHQAEKEKAADILRQMGFETNIEKRQEDHEWVYFKGNFEIELHHRLLYDADTSEDKHVAFMDRVWEYAITEDGIQYHLESEFHFVYLLLHLRKHLLWAGVGIRQFVDITVMMQNANMDWGKIRRYLTELGLLPFSQVCFAMIERWFGITSAFTSAQISDEFFESATNTILSNGVFGCMDDGEKMSDNSIVNANRKHGKILSMLSVVFPPYQKMKKRYPSMAKYPFLLPIMWLRRFIDSILHKNAGNGLNYASKYIVASTTMKERKEMLKNWGL